MALVPTNTRRSHPRGELLPLDPLRRVESSGPGNGNLPTQARRSSGPANGNLPTQTVTMASLAAPSGVMTSAAARGGTPATAAAGGTGVQPPRPPAQPPTPTLPAPPVPPPTYVPRPGTDPRIQDLIRAIQEGRDQQGTIARRLAELGKVNMGPLDLKDIEGQSAQVKALIQALMRGEGINVGNLSHDPEARAYAVAKEREAARMREDAAARLGASGASGSGDFDAEVLGIREATGEAKARQVAELTGKRRNEMTATALSGANLQMSDLDRQARNRQTEYLSKVDLERMRREGILANSQFESNRIGTDLTAKQRLLETLLAERNKANELYRADEERRRTAETTRLAEELKRQELEKQLRERFGPKPLQPLRFG